MGIRRCTELKLEFFHTKTVLWMAGEIYPKSIRKTVIWVLKKKTW